MSDKVRMLCMYQEAQLDAAMRHELAEKATQLYQQHFGLNFTLSVVWIMIPKGQAYIAGRPSRASTVSMPIADGSANAVRHAFMADFCRMWMAVTDCSENEIILSVMDNQLSEEYSKLSIRRINPAKRGYYLIKLACKLIFSKLTQGELHMSSNIR